MEGKKTKVYKSAVAIVDEKQDERNLLRGISGAVRMNNGVYNMDRKTKKQKDKIMKCTD
ncbi:MAG: hypothetical protein WCS30_13995 [Selenomonadaceae bacterium]